MSSKRPGRKPTSRAKVESNRRNAAKSTGPRTRQGKERSSMNGLVHGLTSTEIVRGCALVGEDPKEFLQLLSAFTEVS